MVGYQLSVDKDWSNGVGGNVSLEGRGVGGDD